MLSVFELAIMHHHFLEDFTYFRIHMHVKCFKSDNASLQLIHGLSEAHLLLITIFHQLVLPFPDLNLAANHILVGLCHFLLRNY